MSLALPHTKHRQAALPGAMFLTRSEYDRGVNTFSPEGRLFQVEYAIEAIKIGTTAIGICTSEGVVIAVEKRLLSPLQEPGSVEKIYEVDSHIGVAMSGLSADARTLVDHARSESQYHRFTFNEPMPVESLTQAVCDLALNFGEGDEEQTMARPFGVALLVAGWDHHGPVLYHTDPSGTFTRFDAKAIGAGSEGAQTALQEQFHKNLTLVEAETMAITILKQVMEEKLDASNVEVASVKMPPPKPEVPVSAACHYVPGSKNPPQFSTYSKEQLEEALTRVSAAAS